MKMHKPVCVNCETELSVKDNGVVVVEMFNGDSDIYKLWHADSWKCRKCGYEIVVGFSDSPFAEHHTDNCEELVQMEEAKGRRVIYDKEC
jgi:hypothetical protein